MRPQRQRSDVSYTWDAVMFIIVKQIPRLRLGDLFVGESKSYYYIIMNTCSGNSFGTHKISVLLLPYNRQKAKKRLV